MHFTSKIMWLRRLSKVFLSTFVFCERWILREFFSQNSLFWKWKKIPQKQWVRGVWIISPNTEGQTETNDNNMIANKWKKENLNNTSTKIKNEDQEIPRTLLDLLRKRGRNDQNCLLGVDSRNNISFGQG